MFQDHEGTTLQYRSLKEKDKNGKKEKNRREVRNMLKKQKV
jgi:hypothetical protein